MTSTFFEFPKTRPFINSSYRQSVNKPPVIPYPESNRDGIYSAMKNLQDKVRRLELERTTAEDNLKNLSNETAKYSLCLQKSQETENLANEIVNKQTKVDYRLAFKSTAVASEFSYLEVDSNWRKKCRRITETHSSISIYIFKIISLKFINFLTSDCNKCPSYLRIYLEHNYNILSWSYQYLENKIRELEQKLREEDIHRQMIMDRANDNNYNGLDEHPIKLSERPKTKKIVKKKKKKSGNDKNHPHKSCSKHYDPSSHYRLNLNEIPFVAGTATTPSHSVGANIQKVISMMKSHNLALCSSMYNHGGRSGSVSSASSTTSLDSDMTEILQQLQDEFGQLSFEHKELSNQIEETSDYGVRRDLKRELDRVVRRLETKSQQISKVRAHQQKLSEMKRRVKNRKRENSVKKSLPPRPVSARERTPNKPNLTKQTLNKPTSPRSVAARNVLNDMKKIQTTLRKDDLKWE
ncbi:hypothetical protein LOTGIDRAFT_121151 [Lottia gigantea]|uniref:Cep57 centrosome localisation domain-containing protein n=1 Tax=Lottia gigantea TaxID=225164 RepID=V3ZLM7_LOTGI|nr:hypothetical protein LOTGIDRAFT_121151 [Lottia gigantea]ESO92253.1 hypothetical protein LOTGIDRAFT_121151 [Lottia gigantea]